MEICYELGFANVIFEGDIPVIVKTINIIVKKKIV